MMHLIQKSSDCVAEPLESISVAIEEAGGDCITVSDGANKEYLRVPASSRLTFQTGGALGTHTIRLLSAREEVLSELVFRVEAKTQIEDEGGRFKDLLEMLHRTMCCYGPSGTGTLRWKGKSYRFYVPWLLDHAHVAKGMRYFSDAGRELIDLMALAQREDGMVWSQASSDCAPGYHDTRDDNRNYYTRRDNEIRFMRQPVENHCEYNFVDCFHVCWKSSGDDAWMESLLPHACRALDYTRNSPVRWSEKFGLLKRGYTIDSWDFQAEDKYLVHFPVGTGICIDEERTKFGVFFGDNTGYARACEQLAEMLGHVGQKETAEKYRQRGRDIRERLTALAWNGRFYQHYIEEDPAVKRDFGVDEMSQLAMSNAYSLNRDIPHEQCAAILDVYRDLQGHLPPGSPGEWYAIYPPFERGFEHHNQKWQYMNGGVHGHAAGELARGAFAHGRESYGVDILQRIQKLAEATGGIVRFAYTGAQEPPPPAQQFSPVDIRAVANMDLQEEGAFGVPGWMKEQRPGNDMRNLPAGSQTLAGVPYEIVDPAKNGRKAVIAVSIEPGLVEAVTVPVGQKAAALYLLHTATTKSSTGVGGSCTFVYEDGTEHAEYLVRGTHFAGWWFPHFKQKNAGVAWKGPNPVCTSVGMSWACLKNPHAEKTIQKLIFQASRDGAIYAVVGITLADRLPYHPPGPVWLIGEDTGGPDNWSGALCMAALIEGLAGVDDETTALREVRLSPRWVAASVLDVKATVRYAGSQNYVCYRYAHDTYARIIKITLTGSGDGGNLRLLLPEGVNAVSRILMDGKPARIMIQKVEQSCYAYLPLDSLCPSRVIKIYY